MCDFRRVLSIEYWVSSRLDTQRPYSILNTRWKSHIFMCDFRRVLSIEYRRRASSRNSILNVETRYSILEKNRTLTWAIFVEYRVLSSHVECRVLDTQSQYSILDTRWKSRSFWNWGGRAWITNNQYLTIICLIYTILIYFCKKKTVKINLPTLKWSILGIWMNIYEQVLWFIRSVPTGRSRDV